MRSRVIGSAASVALVLLVVFSIFLATRHVAPEASQLQSPLLGHSAPNFSGTTLDGHQVNLSSERGKIVVLDFWASWCQPCVQSAPELSTFSWQERSRGVIVLGVVFNDDLSSARSFESRFGSLYSSVIDSGGQIANLYGVTAPPTIFVIDGRGRVSATLIGATNVRQLTRAVDRVRS